MLDVADGFRVGEMFRLHQTLSQRPSFCRRNTLKAMRRRGGSNRRPDTSTFAGSRLARNAKSGNDHAVVIGQ